MISFPPAAIMLIGAVLLPLIPRRIRSGAFLLFPALAFGYLIYLNPGDSLHLGFLGYDLTPTRVDELSLCFGYVFVIVTFLGGIYGYHLKDTGEQVATLIYAGSSLGVVFAGDLFTLVFSWEIMAVSSVYLIWARRTPEARGAGMRYIMVHLFGGSVLLAGVLLHISQTGSMVFNHMDGGLAANLILFAFCLNAAVPPLHAWLSDAYPEGTVTGSVYLSAFTTKTAVYVLARGFGGWEVLAWAGAAMAVYGVVYAVLENDIRRLLSYHIISQVGYMVCAVGLGTAEAINGATAHAFTHILYKALLFMGAGTVLYATGRSRLTELGGLARLMPLTFVLYMVGAFSISGFPLFSGFVSKSMVVHAAEVSHVGLVVLLLNLASVGTFLSVGLKLPYLTWFGPKRPVKPTATPRGMYIGMALTSAICIAIGVYPALLYNILPFPIDYRPYTSSHLIETIQLLTFTGLGFWLLMKKLEARPLITLDTDWFYRKPARLTYTVFVVSVNRLFDSVRLVATEVVQLATRLVTNPIAFFTKRGEHRPLPYNPDQYRLPVSAMILIILICFIVFIIWSIVVS